MGRRLMGWPVVTSLNRYIANFALARETTPPITLLPAENNDPSSSVRGWAESVSVFRMMRVIVRSDARFGHLGRCAVMLQQQSGKRSYRISP